MNSVLVYVSPNGTTRESMKLLQREFEQDGHHTQVFDLGRGELRNDFTPVLKALGSSEVVVFGSPAYHMDMLAPMQRLFQELKKSNEEFCCRGLLLLNYAGITSGKAFLNAARLLEQAGIPLVGALKIRAPHFHHTEPFPDDGARLSVRTFYQSLKKNNFTPLGEDRYARLFKPDKCIVSVIYPLVHVIGKRRELPITVQEGTCRRCKKCERECPVDAITVGGKGMTIDMASCIHCYHCVASCPFDAVHSPVEKLDTMIKINKRVVGMEDPSNKVYV